MTNPCPHPAIHRPRRPRGGAGRRAAFTIVELLTVIAIIIVLTAILVPALSHAFGAANRSQTITQLAGINQAISAFRNDFNFEPPLLTSISSTAGVQTPEMQSNPADVLKAYRLNRYMSEFTLPAYLCGVGTLDGQQYPPSGFPNGIVPLDSKNALASKDALQDGAAGAGIRNPGQYKCWTVVSDASTNPPSFRHQTVTTGRVYGPYLDPQVLGTLMEAVEVDPQTMKAKPGTGLVMYRFLDRYGVPIRYYRGWRTTDQTGKPDGEYAPVELRTREAVSYAINPTGEKPDEGALLNSSYMLLAAGQKPITYSNTAAGGAKATLYLYGDVVLTDAFAPFETMPIQSNPLAYIKFAGSYFGVKGHQSEHDMLLDCLKNNVKLGSQ